MKQPGGVVLELFPIVSTRDLERALGFYRDLLGAQVSYTFPGPDGAPVYVGLDIGASHVGIGLATGDPTGPGPISLWVYVDRCDELVDRARRSGVTITAEPADQPWGERVARLLDPDGNEIIIGQRSS